MPWKCRSFWTIMFIIVMVMASPFCSATRRREVHVVHVLRPGMTGKDAQTLSIHQTGCHDRYLPYKLSQLRLPWLDLARACTVMENRLSYRKCRQKRESVLPFVCMDLNTFVSISFCCVVLIDEHWRSKRYLSATRVGVTFLSTHLHILHIYNTRSSGCLVDRSVLSLGSCLSLYSYTQPQVGH
jgi:hypothetical protein